MRVSKWRNIPSFRAPNTEERVKVEMYFRREHLLAFIGLVFLAIVAGATFIVVCASGIPMAFGYGLGGIVTAVVGALTIGLAFTLLFRKVCLMFWLRRSIQRGQFRVTKCRAWSKSIIPGFWNRLSDNCVVQLQSDGWICDDEFILTGGWRECKAGEKRELLLVNCNGIGFVAY